MTVKDLINQLIKHPPETEVRYSPFYLPFINEDTGVVEEEEDYGMLEGEEVTNVFYVPNEEEIEGNAAQKQKGVVYLW